LTSTQCHSLPPCPVCLCPCMCVTESLTTTTPLSSLKNSVFQRMEDIFMRPQGWIRENFGQECGSLDRTLDGLTVVLRGHHGQNTNHITGLASLVHQCWLSDAVVNACVCAVLRICQPWTSQALYFPTDTVQMLVDQLVTYKDQSKGKQAELSQPDSDHPLDPLARQLLQVTCSNFTSTVSLCVARSCCVNVLTTLCWADSQGSPQQTSVSGGLQCSLP
jgi:hypothetical protein